MDQCSLVECSHGTIQVTVRVMEGGNVVLCNMMLQHMVVYSTYNNAPS